MTKTCEGALTFIIVAWAIGAAFGVLAGSMFLASYVSEFVAPVIGWRYHNAAMVVFFVQWLVAITIGCVATCAVSTYRARRA